MNTSANLAPPVAAQMLGENIAKLGAKDRDFATSLLRQLSDRGQLSAKQWHWIGVLAGRATQPAQSAPAAVEVGDIAPIVTLIERAQSRLKYPAILLGTEGPDTLRISVAGAASKCPGTINVTTTDRDADGRRPWVGRITKEGAFLPSPKLSPNAVANVTTALRAFAADPAGVAAAYGHRTGHCCFCSRRLDDERSTEVGYGPICAGHFGLPWGNRAGWNTRTDLTCEAAHEAA